MIAIIVVIAGFGAYKYLQAENLKNDIANVKTEIKSTMISDHDLKYLKDNQLINADQVKIIDNAKSMMARNDKTKTYLKDLNTSEYKLFKLLNNDLIISLTKKVNDAKASQIKALNSLKVSTKAEKDNKAKYLKVLNDLKVGTALDDLIKNNQALVANQKSINTLNKTIKNRVAKEKAAAQAVADYSSNNYSGNTNSGGNTTKANNGNKTTAGSNKFNNGYTMNYSDFYGITQCNYSESDKVYNNGGNGYSVACH